MAGFIRGRSVAQVVRLKAQKPERLYESIAGICAQAEEAAEESARFERSDPLTAGSAEIEFQRQDLAKLAR